ncbi:hypothetical protein [Alteromonas sp. S015]|uniref:hypothetical protein n=1 Tax=Alteromonas sp. S015 TaxID=3117401 RepID=UPI002FE3E98E
MFSRNCPSCGKKISFNWIKKNAKNDFFNCPHCNCVLTPRFSNVIINSIILGAGTGAILAKFTNLPIELIIVICSLSGMYLQKYIDILFSLEKVDE